VSFGYDLHDREPEAAAGVGAGVAAPPETLEELLRVLVAKPYSSVLDDEDRPPILTREETAILPPGGVNLMALSSRFPTA